MPNSPTGIELVARHAGVSITTVSHALSGRRPVADATRARVLASIQELGYRPNQLARSFATQRTRTTALIIPDIANPFYPALARSVQDVLRRDGYQTIICNTDGLRAEERSFLADAVDSRLDGVIFVPLASRAADLVQVTAADIPLVLMTADADGPGVASRSPTTDLVHSDDQRGMADAARYLLTTGHQRIGFVNGISERGPAPRRLAGFRQAMDQAGIVPTSDLVVATSFTRAGGVEGARRLLSLAEPPTAVLCANDLIAIGVLDVARSRGLDVPDHLAVVGFDDIEAASLVSPPLTTVLNPATELGHACARLLLDRMTGQYDSVARQVVVANPLVKRMSA